MRKHPAGVGVLAGALALCCGGCTLLFDPPGDPGPQGLEGVECDGEGCLVTRSIGSDARDFSSMEAWESARSGDLVRRRVFRIAGLSGTFEPRELVRGETSGCEGALVPAREEEPTGAVLFFDPRSESADCEQGETLSGMGSGASARISERLGAGTTEKGVLYADSVFEENVLIDGWTADSAHFVWLTAAPEHRHHGRAGGGAVLEPGEGHGIDIREPHTRVEWIEVRNWGNYAGASYDGIRISADEVEVAYALVHDGGLDAENADANGIAVDRAAGTTGVIRATVRNSIVYNVGRAGIWVQNTDEVELDVLASTAFNCVINDEGTQLYGCVGARGELQDDSVLDIRVRAINVIAAGDEGFELSGNGAGGDGPRWTTDTRNNLSSDSSAPGESPVWDVKPGSLFQDLDSEGELDLHLTASEAEGAGANLADLFGDDIDEEPRPISGGWDIGADERP